MKPIATCQNCRSQDFLGVECAWPDRHCLGPRLSQRSHWRPKLRLVALTTTGLLFAVIAWQILS